MNWLKKVWEIPLEALLFLFAFGILLTIFDVILSESIRPFITNGFGLTEKSEVLKYLGITFSGALLALQQIYFYRRVKAMEQNAQSQTKAIELQTQSVNQERFKDAIAHLSNEKESVRLGGIYTLAHLGRDQSEKYLTTVIEIIAAHLRTTTQDPVYQEKYAKQPSNEVQSALDLLFRKGEDSLHQKGSKMVIDLSQSFFRGARLANGILHKVNFSQTELQNADLEEVYLQGARLRYAEFKYANLFSAHLQRADLTKAKLQHAYLYNAQLQLSNLIKAQLQCANLSLAQLQSASLIYAQLSGATLANALLQNAIFYHSQLQGAYLRDAQLQEALFEGNQLGGLKSFDSFSSNGYVERLIEGVGKVGDFQGVIFSGGITQEEASRREEMLKKLIEECPSYLDKEGVKIFTGALKSVITTNHQHSRIAANHNLPEGAENIPYTQEQAEQWIAEYKEATKEVDGEGND